MIQEEALPATPGSVSRTNRQRSPWRTGAVIFAVVATTDLSILGVATLAGVHMAVTPRGGPTMTVGVAAVLLTLLTAVGVGTLVLALVGKTREGRSRLLAVAGLVAGVLSLALPLTAEATVGTKITLTSMHLVAALTWFIVLRRSTPSRLPRRVPGSRRV